MYFRKAERSRILSCLSCATSFCNSNISFRYTSSFILSVQVHFQCQRKGLPRSLQILLYNSYRQINFEIVLHKLLPKLCSVLADEARLCKCHSQSSLSYLSSHPICQHLNRKLSSTAISFALVSMLVFSIMSFFAFDIISKRLSPQTAPLIYHSSV